MFLSSQDEWFKIKVRDMMVASEFALRFAFCESGDDDEDTVVPLAYCHLHHPNRLPAFNGLPPGAGDENYSPFDVPDRTPNPYANVELDNWMKNEKKMNEERERRRKQNQGYRKRRKPGDSDDEEYGEFDVYQDLNAGGYSGGSRSRQRSRKRDGEKQTKKMRKMWTPEEENCLRAAVAKHGENSMQQWEAIKSDNAELLGERTPGAIRDKWFKMKARGKGNAVAVVGEEEEKKAEDEEDEEEEKKGGEGGEEEEGEEEEEEEGEGKEEKKEEDIMEI